MNWKFWQNFRKENSSAANVVKLPKPKELPDRVGIHLVTSLHEDPDWIWSLKWVVRRKPDDHHLMEFRIFNPYDATMKSIRVVDFSSLDSHPHLVLFEGLFDKETGIVKIKKTQMAA